MAKYRKKPVVIEAVQWTGINGIEVHSFLSGGTRPFQTDKDMRIEIETLEGVVTASVGDWIIRGISGEHYPCKPDIFEQTYELVTTRDDNNIHNR